MNKSEPTPDTPHPGMGFRQFVAFIAALMATNAIAIDSMLPALPEIGRSLRIDTANHTQIVITAYLLGFGGAQILYGTLADRYGRRPVLMVGLAIYTIASIGAFFAGSLGVMILARATQGIGSAATRILAITIVRDCYSGRQMARVMSLAFIVFLTVPIFAPSIGQIIMLAAPWRAIFLMLCLFGGTLFVWTLARLPETLKPENRTPISIAGITFAFGLVFRSRVTVGYMCAMTMVMGGLFGFINSAQQVFAVAFHAEQLFTLIFALIAVFMALSSLLNSRVVGRHGTRKVSHAAMLGYLAVTLVHAVIGLAGWETIWTFSILQAAMMFCFGLMMSNFNAMAMEPVGAVAGTASSALGFCSTVGGALVGFGLGQLFDGTTLPLLLGFAGLGLAAFICVLIAERGRLFGSTAAAGGTAHK
ncbi:DHA1 family bicyclomycin/chloramphenicol resistance-like MFS transporter [Angulomicrobium tetraedrale]|uniref:DHA1 family bicyclomycin/chloramphenicol resistance-like MFS transporter n=1 Tax=Ancylobacter tetraedralis TaxID=217068 RepID=A0A839ZAG9_9HYPH|nr:multidrug effflux MFS transporter [Ancylobacter tetraedralis]MBB3771724.1 DHA1 family bicyclomycin/chloramphenicol resistance-like MFS transporter [Ancylobacter tetraedralis]